MSDVLASSVTIPPHVPASLVWDDEIGRFTMELDDPYVAGARLHQGPELVWSTHGYRGEQGAWMVVSFEAMREAFTDCERFSSVGSAGTQALLGVEWSQVPIEFDLPDQRMYRKFINPLFSPSAVNKRVELVERTCARLIDAFATRGSCEFITEFAQLLPSYIFLEVMGMPRDKVEQFLDWERETLWTDDVMVRLAGARKIRDYLEELIAERREQPGDDLISAITQAEFEGRPITHDEIIGYCYSLFLGGLDTVMSVMGFSMWHLAINKPLQQRLRENPDLIGKAVDEFLRAHGVVVMRRTVSVDCEFRGVAMKAGDQVLLPTPLAGRDPRHFDNPHLIDPDRRDKSGLTFGSGIHTCVGMHLARRELRIVYTQMLERFADISLSDPSGVQYRTGITWGVDRLPLKLESA
ncbi:MAG: cytochrome P450 [Novosphingobium sp.]|nr:cytochrome P450 [Novosphingobium sp.]